MEGALNNPAGRQRALRAVQAGDEKLDWRSMWVQETLAAVGHAPGCDNQALAEMLRISLRTVRLRMWKLEQAGLVGVDLRGRGNKRHYFLVNPEDWL
jgi:predicted transcriptional regulator